MYLYDNDNACVHTYVIQMYFMCHTNAFICHTNVFVCHTNVVMRPMQLTL